MEVRLAMPPGLHRDDEELCRHLAAAAKLMRRKG
jgi:hypothetical protein